MRTHQPKNFEELLSIKRSIRFDSWSPYLPFFRGQVSNWSIKPNITRNPNLDRLGILKSESLLYSEFSKGKIKGVNVLPHFKKKDYKYAQDWHNLFQMQHLGFYTRLTDWSQNFETALFFAIHDEEKRFEDEDGVFWIYKCPYDEPDYIINFNKTEEYDSFDLNPFKLDKFYLIKHYTQFPDNFMNYAGEMRRFRQGGSFIISTTEKIDLPIENVPEIIPFLEKIIISPSLKKEIKAQLNETSAEYYLYGSDVDNQIAIDKLTEITKLYNQKYFG